LEETVAFMPDDPFSGLGLRSVELTDQNVFRPYFASLIEPLSDYTFSQIYTWRNSLHIVWKVLAGHLCVFANGTGDLTLLIPPIGQGGSDAALRQAFELMDDYNAARGVRDRSRVEYASGELLARFDPAGLDIAPMGTDYVYDVNRMIDLAGGDLASKRQAKNRFQRLYPHRVETYDPAKHFHDCLALLNGWRIHQDAQHLEEPNANAIKRQKETIATELALRSATELGFKGMVVYVEGERAEVRGQGLENAQTSSSFLTPNPQTPNPSLKAFTFGEYLSGEQSSIVIEKTDLETKGLAQFIFSEFCRQHWADRPLCNVGDDWGVESLAWTKMSYRPVKLLQKYAMKKAPICATGYQPVSQIIPPPAVVSLPEAFNHGLVARATTGAAIRLANKSDLPATLALENACFNATVSLKKRQLQYLQQRASAIFLVAEQAGEVIGEGIALVRKNRRGLSGRIYSVAVDQRHRGQQIGRRLLQALVDELAARGVSRVYLEVEQANTKAIALYQRNGFRSIGILPHYYGPAQDGLHMMKTVAAAPTLFDALVEAAR
jgi:ribosomal protein S18 acetylase RimI-like enzyme